MNKKIVAFGASNSRHSINKQFANYTATQVEGARVNLIDLNDYEMPIYSIDRQNETGIPEEAHAFLNAIRDADGIVISFAEHNGAYTVAFKNIFDWASRAEKNVWMNKPMFLLATAPGKGGGKMVLEIAAKKFSYMSSNKVMRFSLPEFSENFDDKKGIVNKELKMLFENELDEFVKAL